MFVVYRDALGYVSAELDFESIDFVDGEAYFSSDYEEYRIPIESIVQIGKDPIEF